MGRGDRARLRPAHGRGRPRQRRHPGHPAAQGPRRCRWSRSTSGSDARGVQTTREHDIPLIIGDAGREETLRAANIGAGPGAGRALHRRRGQPRGGAARPAAQPGIRVVLRLFDGDFAELVQRSYGIMVTRSVSFVAAPAFASAMLEREVIGTIAVERRVLLVAEVPVGEGSELDGRPVIEAHQTGQVRVIALAPRRRAGRGRARTRSGPPLGTTGSPPGTASMWWRPGPAWARSSTPAARWRPPPPTRARPPSRTRRRPAGR